MIFVSALLVVVAQDLLYHFPDNFLLGRNFAGRVNVLQVKFPGQNVINRKHAALELTETRGRVSRLCHIHTRLVILKLGPACHQAFEGHLNRYAEVKC